MSLILNKYRNLHFVPSRFSVVSLLHKKLSTNRFINPSAMSETVDSIPETMFSGVVDRCDALRHLDRTQKRVLFDTLLWPTFSYIRKEQLIFREERQGKGIPKSTFFVGISAPQGCGKTTLTSLLEAMFDFIGVKTISMSLDDFYLTAADQEALSNENPDNSLMMYRGNAGTHDMPLLEETMSNLRDLNSNCCIPRYDKAARGGRGDRFPREEWSKAPADLEIVLFEGWMLGFSPQNSNLLDDIHRDLRVVDTLLRNYEGLNRSFDCWIVFEVDDPQYVYKWRLQAEHAMRDSGKSSLSDKQVQDFVDRFMPAYRAYLGHLYRYGPQRRIPSSVLQIKIDSNRRPVEILERPDSRQIIHARL